MTKFNFFHFLEARSETVFFRLNREFSPLAFERSVDIVRIIFSLIMLLRYLFTYDSAPLFEHYFWGFPVLYILLYAFLLLGFLTPYTSLLLAILEGVSPLFIAVKVNALLPFFLFFLGAGKQYSLDSLIKWKLPSIHFEKSSFPAIRFYLLLPYALLCFLAFITHLQDPLWQKLESSERIFQSDVMVTVPDFLRHLPSLFYKLTDILQLSWEALFLPMMFFPATLVLAGVYGMAFFLSSIFFINLSFLGHFEILMWVLIFHQELNTLWKKVRRI